MKQQGHAQHEKIEQIRYRDRERKRARDRKVEGKYSKVQKQTERLQKKMSHRQRKRQRYNKKGRERKCRERGARERQERGNQIKNFLPLCSLAPVFRRISWKNFWNSSGWIEVFPT